MINHESSKASSIPDTITLDGGTLIYYEHFFDLKEESQYFQQLLDSLAWRQDRLTIGGRTVPIPRLQAWYGDPNTDYQYSGLKLKSSPFTPLLRSIKGQIEQAASVHFPNIQFNSVLANLYRDQNDSVSWHADDEPELGTHPVIASLSLGETRRFRLRQNRNKKNTYSIDLPGGSLLIMAGALQHNWQHQIPKSKRILSKRLNLTFRQII